MKQHRTAAILAAFTIGFVACAIMLLCIAGFWDWRALHTAHIQWYLFAHRFPYNYGDTHAAGTIELDCSRQPISSIACLQGLPTYALSLANTDVEDLSPLYYNQSLTSLDLEGSKVKDVASLEGLWLTELSVSKTAVSDLAPLRGKPLVVFRCHDSSVTNIAPVINPKLRELSINGCPIDDLSPLTNTTASLDLFVDVDRYPYDSEQIRLLRGMTNLYSLNGYAPDYFWSEYDAKGSPPSRFRPPPGAMRFQHTPATATHSPMW